VRTEDDTSVWLTNKAEVVKALKKAAGTNRYESFMGIHTYGANGVYFVDKVAEKHGLWLVKNDTKGIKGEVEQEEALIEPQILWPLLRGRDVETERYASEQFVLFPYSDDGNIIPESSLKVSFPRAYAFLRKHRDLLGERSEYRRRKYEGEWYQIFCVYPGTFSPQKVVWREQSSALSPAVLKPKYRKPIIPDHKLMFIPMWHRDEALFIGGLLRTSILILLVESSSIETQTSTRVMDNLALPKFDDGNPHHKRISELCENWENAAHASDQGKMTATAQELDRAAAKLWDITDRELTAIQEGLAETGKSRRAAREFADSTDRADQ
jgi:hypothetical protein